MRESPSIVPGNDQDVYLVLDDFGRMGCAWRETNVEDTDPESVVSYLLQGQYANPVRIVAFNTAEGWSRDVSEDVARVLRQRCADQDRELPEFLQQFLDRHKTARQDHLLKTASNLLGRKQQLLERLTEVPGPNESDEIQRLLNEIDRELDLLDQHSSL